jgi:phasin protein
MPENTTGGRAEIGFASLTTPFGLEALMALNRPALAAMAQVNGKVYENLAAFNKSWAAFLNRRLKEDLGVASQLAACKSMQDVYGLYSGYLQTAMSDYRAEIEEMSKLGKTLADDTMEAMQHAQANGRDVHAPH